jgi:acetyl esterase/lipase
VGAALTLSLTACTPRAIEPTWRLDVPACSGGGRQLHVDLALPPIAGAPTAARAAMVFVHGGGWQAGHRRDYHPLMRGFAQAGIVGVAVEYRFLPGAPFPAQLEDVKCGVRWLRAHAGELGVDARRIGAIGGSAGAHLVAMLGATQSAREHEGQGGWAEQSSAVQVVVAHGGPHDLTVAMDPTHAATLRSQGRASVRALVGDDPMRARAASAALLLDATMPPTLVLHGQNDPVVPADQARRLADALTRSGVPHELVVIPAAGHMDFGADPDAVGARVRAFLQRHLGAV